jgi:glycosyltransferase involved in cell wall biosynthesis
MGPGKPCDVTVVANDIGAVGGMERVLRELILGLRRRGHRVTVISRVCELPPDEGITFRRIVGPRRPFPIAYPWFMLLASLMLARWRRGVVISTGAILLARVDAVAVHYCHQVGPTNTDRQTAPARANAWLTSHLKRKLERISFHASHAKRFVCVSDGVAAELREHYPELADRVMTIHNGVDTQAFRPGLRRADADALRARLGLEDGRLLAAFVGGEWDRKGLGPTLEALALEPAWDLAVAGIGDEERFRELASSLGVSERVQWLGLVQDIAPVYELADAFVFPSSYETFSLVTFEAAASGLAILAAPVSGVRELIEDGVNGFLISRDPHEIAERLRCLARDPQLRADLGAAATASVARFSWESMVDGYAALFEQLSSST